jgi:hypothetical protein
MTCCAADACGTGEPEAMVYSTKKRVNDQEKVHNLFM